MAGSDEAHIGKRTTMTEPRPMRSHAKNLTGGGSLPADLPPGLLDYLQQMRADLNDVAGRIKTETPAQQLSKDVEGVVDVDLDGTQLVIMGARCTFRDGVWIQVTPAYPLRKIELPATVAAAGGGTSSGDLVAHSHSGYYDGGFLAELNGGL